MISRPLTGRTALVTGASRGLGRAIVEKFAEMGCEVLAGVRNPNLNLSAEFARLANTHQTKITEVHVDLSSAEKGAACANHIAASNDIHILVNNAGIMRRGNILDISVQDWNDLFAVNIKLELYTSN